MQHGAANANAAMQRAAPPHVAPAAPTAALSAAPPVQAAPATTTYALDGFGDGYGGYLGAGAGATSSRVGKIYMCGKCGQPKKGHTCPFKKDKDDEDDDDEA